MYNLRTPEEVFKDYRGRRAGLVKALTTEKDNLCLYGLPDETWEVGLPAEEVPPELPEPALGINFARDGMEEKNWLSLVAVHSDAWLFAVAFYFGARFEFQQEERRRLFNMINSLPTIFEVVATSRKTVKEKSSNGSSKSTSKTKHSQSESYTKLPNTFPSKDVEESGEDDDGEAEERDTTLCGLCGESYEDDEFWICCDVCERWYHGKCVRITPARAELIKQYNCPECSSYKRVRVF